MLWLSAVAPPRSSFRAFVDAAHLLGKAVGFDLEPHVTQFALTVFEAPHLFRWIKLSEADRDRLDHGLSYEAMLGAEWQMRLAEDVRRIVRSRLTDLGLSELEAREADSADTARLKRQASHELTVELIERGYWTIPLHHWNGVGVPAFVGFDHAARHPRFCYLSRDGCDVSGQTYGVLTPLAFYGGLPANREPDRPPTRNEDAIAFYGRIFTWWRDHFGFDFVRYDYVGNVRETVRDDDSDYAVSDRPTPYVLRQCVRAARSPDKPFVGAFAENLGDEPEAYGEIGFDVTLGSDMVGRVDRAHLEKCFRIYERLVGYNRERPSPLRDRLRGRHARHGRALDTRRPLAETARLDRGPSPYVPGSVPQLRHGAPPQVRGDGPS